MESGGLALLEKREKEGCDLPTWFSSIMTGFEQGVLAGVRGWDTVMGGGRQVRRGWLWDLHMWAVVKRGCSW